MSRAPFTAPFLREYGDALALAEAALRVVDHQAAERIAAAASPVPRGLPRVVVVGEAKRGKSSLVNALLGEDVSPVGLLETTATALAFHGAGPDEVEVLVHRPGVAEPLRVPRDELARWVTLDGLSEAAGGPVRWVDVPSQAPLLQHLSLVDTPGLGGLASAVGRITLESIEHASAVVFVGECHTELTSVELDFLRQAADRVETVLVVLGGAGDVDPEDLELILAADRERLAGAGTRLAGLELLPVDTVTAQRSRRHTDPERRARDWERSGLARLEQQLVALTSRRAWSLAWLNSLRATLTLVSAAEAVLADRITALEDPAHEGALVAERERLAQQRRTLGRSAKAQLQAAVANERIDVTRHIQQLLLQLEQEHAARIRSGDAEIAALPEQVAADLELVALQVSDRLARGLERMLADRLAELFEGEDLTGLLAQLGARMTLAEGSARMLPERDRDLVLTVVSTAGVAFMAGRAGAGALGMLGVAGTAFLAPLAAVGLGVTAGVALVRLRALHGRRADALAWLARSMPEIRNELVAVASARLNDAQAALGLALDELLDERIAALDVQLRQIEQDRRAAAKAPALLRQQAAALATARDRVAALVPKLQVSPASVGAWAGGA